MITLNDMQSLQAHAERLVHIRRYGRESKINTSRAEVSVLNRFTIPQQAELMDLVIRMELAEQKVPSALSGGPKKMSERNDHYKDEVTR